MEGANLEVRVLMKVKIMTGEQSRERCAQKVIEQHQISMIRIQNNLQRRGRVYRPLDNLEFSYKNVGEDRMARLRARMR